MSLTCQPEPALWDSMNAHRCWRPALGQRLERTFPAGTERHQPSPGAAGAVGAASARGRGGRAAEEVAGPGARLGLAQATAVVLLPCPTSWTRSSSASSSTCELAATVEKRGCRHRSPLDLAHGLLGDARFQTRRRAKSAVFDFLEKFYSPRRRHSALHMRSPLAFEAACQAAIDDDRSEAA